MYRISKTFSFSASHQLQGLPVDHPCSRLHGHNYSVQVTLQGKDLDSVGMVLDYRELGSLKRHLDEVYDHRHLNEVLNENPTAENLAKALFVWCRSRWPQVQSVRVSETPLTWAEYSEP